MGRLADAWLQVMPLLIDALVRCAAAHHQFREEMRAQGMALVQGRVATACSQWASQHRCSVEGCAPGSSCGSISNAQPLKMPYVGLACSGELSVPTWGCTHCMCRTDPPASGSATYTPSPIEVGCFAGTPQQAKVWFDLEVHHAYKFLGLRCGLSSTGELLFLHAQRVTGSATAACAA